VIDNLVAGPLARLPQFPQALPDRADFFEVRFHSSLTIELNPA
jgi:hypothetical protein